MTTTIKKRQGEKRGAATPSVGAQASEKREITQTIEAVTIVLPLAELKPQEYATRHIDLTLPVERAETLKRLTDGLIGISATLGDGRKVTNGADALRWILDGLAAAKPEAPEAPEA